MNLPPNCTEDDLNAVTSRVIGCAIEVHRVLGPGLLESSYRAAMTIELGLHGLNYEQEVAFPTIYKSREVGRHRVDLIVERLVVVEIKAVAQMNPLFEAQAINYLRIANKPLALLINFNTRLLKEGIRRLVL
jgi:GxxExxY protein